MPAKEQTTGATPSPELLIASVLHLMSHYLADIDNAGAGANLSLAIERHFQALSAMPGLPPVLRGTCSQLAQHWGSLVASNSARIQANRPRTSMLDRLRRLVAIPPVCFTSNRGQT
ncbi:MAG: hypothetical protein V4693_08090 [Pseudomonadota bacterium]